MPGQNIYATTVYEFYKSLQIRTRIDLQIEEKVRKKRRTVRSQPATTEVNKRPQIITRIKTYGKLYHCFYQVRNLLRPITDEIKGSSNMVSEKNRFKM